MDALHTQSSAADRSGSTWLEVGEETVWWIRGGITPDVTLCSTFQPIFGLRSSNVVGTEALLRAYLSDGAQISPSAMFTRRSGVEAISLDQRCHSTHLHNAANVLQSGERLFLNFRPETLLVDGYAREFVHTVRRANLSPCRIVIEVIESAGPLHQLISAVERFREHGFQIALDDFGIGLSNIDRLVQLRPNFVKLDRSLLVYAMQNVRAAAVFSRLVNLSHDAGSAVVVEGVETKADLDFAAMVDADMAQGFYLARPATLRMPYGHAESEIEDIRYFHHHEFGVKNGGRVKREIAACQ